MTTAERLYQVAREMPEPMLAELLDFAEFLRQKIPGDMHAGGQSLLELKGGLENSAVFEGDPMLMQKSLRDEWNYPEKIS